MPKDKPIRNPGLNPAGLSPGELERHRRSLLPPPPGGAPDDGRCRFMSSYGGVLRCEEPAYLDGFCEFHHGCFQRGEISSMGRILDAVKDQRRRREINLHGIALPDQERVAEDPLTGGRRGAGS